MNEFVAGMWAIGVVLGAAMVGLAAGSVLSSWAARKARSRK